MKKLLLPLFRTVRLKTVLLLSFVSFSVLTFAETNCGHISGFAFSNGNLSTTITNGENYTLSDLPNNFYVDVLVSGFSESARIKVRNLSTGQTMIIGENYLPYTFPSGNGAWNLGYGQFEVEAKIFKYNKCQGYHCDIEKIKFTLTSTPPCGQIDGLEFSNGADTVSIVNGGSYDINTLPSDFYIDVIVSGNTESAFNHITNLDTGEVVTNGENHLPYTYPGGEAPWALGTGTFKFSSKIFKYNNCKGTKCDHICITFTLYEDNCGEISGFEFSNGADTATIVDGVSYDVNDLPDGFYINGLVSGDSESFVYQVTNLDTGEVYNITENLIDYTFPAGNQSWDLGTGTFEIKASLFSHNHGNGTKCDEEIIIFTLTDQPEPCEVAFGHYTIDQASLILDQGNSSVTAMLAGDEVIPAGYSVGLVVTQTDDLVVYAFSNSLSVQFTEAGNYRVHLLIYNENTLDLSSVVFGQTTAAEVLATIAANGICAGLDVTGFPVIVLDTDPQPRMMPTGNTIVKTQKILSNDIKLYPNPIVNDLNVELLLLDNEIMEYSFRDLNGRSVLSGRLDSSTLGKTKIETGYISNGFYILSFESNYRSFSRKVQINR